MGKKTYASSQTVRMMESKDFKTSIELATNRYIALSGQKLRPSRNDTLFSECLKETQTNSLVRKYTQAYRYARNKEDYYFGAPKFTVTRDPETLLTLAFIDYIEKYHGTKPQIVGAQLSERNLYHSAWERLISKYGYDASNNELVLLSVKHDTPVYLKSSQMYLTQQTVNDLEEFGSTNQFGLAMSYGKCFDRGEDTTRIQPDYIISDSNKLVFTYAYSKNGVITDGTESFNLAYQDIVQNEGDIIEDDEEVYHAVYILNGQYHWFTYELGSDSIPELENLDDEELVEGIGEYFPRIYTRSNRQTITKLHHTDKKRKSTENMMNILGLNLAEVTDQIHSQIEINKHVRYIYLHLSLAINTELDDGVKAKYFYKYFNQLYELNPDEDSAISKKGFAIKLKDTEYDQTLSFRRMVKVRHEGSKLPVGQYRVREGLVRNPSSPWNRDVRTSHTIYYQESETHYWELIVYDLKVVHHYAGKERVANTGNDKNLCIPVDKKILDSMSIKEREIIINRGFQLTVSTKQVVKKKWYQSGIFKVVMGAISIAANLFVPGSGITIQALLTSVAVTVATALAVNIAVNLLVKLATELGLSSELLAVVTFAATAVTIAYSKGSIDLSKLGNAKTLMQSLNQSLGIYQKQLTASFKAIQKEMAEFSQHNEERYKKLEEAQQLLNTGVGPIDMALYSPPLASTVAINPGETPDEFHQRMAFVDISDVVDDMVLNYVPTALTVYPKTKPPTYSPTEVEEVLFIT